MLTSEVVQDTARFEKLRDEWRQLQDSSGNDCVFLTWEWLYTWWCHLAEDRRLFIVTVRQNGRLIAIAPFAIRPSQWKRLLPFKAVEFLGSGYVGSDYLDIIVRKGAEAEALDEIAVQLERHRLLLQLSNVRDAGTVVHNLVDRLQERLWRHSRVVVDQCPHIDLRDKTYDDFMASLGKAHRYNVRRRLRNLHKQFHVELRRADDEHSRRETLKFLIEHHLERWSTRGGSSGFHTRALIDFHEAFTRTALAQGWLRLFQLTLDDRPVAAFYCLNYRDKFYYYQTGFDKAFSAYSVGLTGIAMLVEGAVAEGVCEFDFLHGNEDYKYLWTKNDRQIVRFDLFPPYLTGRLHQQAMELRSDIKRAFAVCQRALARN